MFRLFVVAIKRGEWHGFERHYYLNESLNSETFLASFTRENIDSYKSAAHSSPAIAEYSGGTVFMRMSLYMRVRAAYVCVW